MFYLRLRHREALPRSFDAPHDTVSSLGLHSERQISGFKDLIRVARRGAIYTWRARNHPLNIHGTEQKEKDRPAKVLSRMFDAIRYDRAGVKNQQICLWLIIRLIINDHCLGSDSTVRLRRNMALSSVSLGENKDLTKRPQRTSHPPLSLSLSCLEISLGLPREESD